MVRHAHRGWVVKSVNFDVRVSLRQTPQNVSVARKLYDAAERQQVPIKATLELVSACNLDCVHCYVTHDKQNAMKTDDAKRIIDELHKLGCFYLTLTGGEIALRRDLFELVAHARKRSMMVQLLTSGTLWGPSEWQRVAELGVDSVRLSVYAADPAVHDEVTTVAGSWDKTMASVRGLQAVGVPAIMVCPIMTVNHRAIPELVTLAQTMGATLALSANITWTDQGDARTGDLALSAHQLAELYADPRVRPLIENENPCETNNDDAPCGVGKYSLYIQSTGDVLPCTRWPYPAGNVMRESLASVWRDSPVLAHARDLRASDLKSCTSCGDSGLCDPCAGMALRERGTLELPSETVCANAAAKSILRYGESRRHAVRARLPIVA